MPDARACYAAEWLRFAEGKLNADADKAYIDWLMTRFTRNTRIVDLVAAIVGSDTFRYRRTGGRCAMNKQRKDQRTRRCRRHGRKPAIERRIPRTLSRRALLRGALGVGVALPWLELMRPRGLRAQAAVDAAQALRRLLQPVRHHPGELALDASDADDAGHRASRCRRSCEPLAPFKNDIVVLRGMNMESTHAVGPIANVHDQGMTHMLTAIDLVKGPAGAGRANHFLDGSAGGPSIDQHIAAAIGGADAAAVAGAGRREHGHVPRDAGHAHVLRAGRPERPVQARDPDPAGRRSGADLRAPDRQHAGRDDRADPGGAAEPEVGARLRQRRLRRSDGPAGQRRSRQAGPAPDQRARHRDARDPADRRTRRRRAARASARFTR